MYSGLAFTLSRVRLDAGMCGTCGQLHESHGTHLYDYHQPVDEDLMCRICLQPLVTPLDTICGHTFCSRCIHNYLSLQQQCPVDRKALTIAECQPSSILVRRAWLIEFCKRQKKGLSCMEVTDVLVQVVNDDGDDEFPPVFLGIASGSECSYGAKNQTPNARGQELFVVVANDNGEQMVVDKTT